MIHIYINIYIYTYIYIILPIRTYHTVHGSFRILLDIHPSYIKCDLNVWTGFKLIRSPLQSFHENVKTKSSAPACRDEDLRPVSKLRPSHLRNERFHGRGDPIDLMLISWA